MPDKQHHRTHRTGWLRAAVLGANDGLISVASLLIGVVSSHAPHAGLLPIGIAGLVAGAMAMAAGEYVSVSSQADTESADLEIERKSIRADEAAERDELTEIYVQRGIEPELAKLVAAQLMRFDALGAHAREELGITDSLRARPLQAAVVSALSFTAGAAIPVLTSSFAPNGMEVALIAGISLSLLAALGALAAWAGGASLVKGAARLLGWGAVAMAVTAGVGAIFGLSAPG